MSVHPEVTRAEFGRLADGTVIHTYHIRTGELQMEVISYGAIVTALRTPDRRSHLEDVVLGRAALTAYLDNPPYLGAVVGRYANRIARGRFGLDGRTYQLARNDGDNHLHGGTRGFDKRAWQAETVERGDCAGVRLSRSSAAGEEGYPGRLDAAVSYLVSESTVTIEFEARSSEATPVNLTQHSYFNLGGPSSATIQDHALRLHASRVLPVRPDLIPIGTLAPVAGSPFDFRTAARLGARLEERHEQLSRAGGFDHTFVLDRSGKRLTLAAELSEPRSGRHLSIWTTEPGVQLYTGQKLDGRLVDAHGRVLNSYAGLCLETQHFPDSPNQPTFPSTILRPSQVFRSTTVWSFGVSDMAG